MAQYQATGSATPGGHKMNYADPIEVARDAGKHIHHFHGGLRLKHNKRISCQVAVERPSLPEFLVVPLLQHAGDIAEPFVKAGDHVLKGQQIGRCEPCAAVHAPTSGTVEAVEDRLMTHSSGTTGPCVVIGLMARINGFGSSPSTMY
jgi:Na+-translocating ferredoxin:NAD+ oxidoreductase RnfC subunit